jgi:hypothetical protein
MNVQSFSQIVAKPIAADTEVDTGRSKATVMEVGSAALVDVWGISLVLLGGLLTIAWIVALFWIAAALISSVT